MKTIKLILILGAISILISGCGGDQSAQSLEVSCDEFNQEPFLADSITINSGDEITIKLCSNPSTGFQWSEEPENSNPEILSQTSHDYMIQGESEDPLPPGTPGIEIWTLTTKDPGQSQLYFEYSRNWEGGEKGTWTYTLDVTVK